MKKVLFCLVIVAVIFGFSCKSAPTSSGVTIQGEATQERVNRALTEIYDAYRSRLDMTGAQEYTVQSGDTLSGIARRYYGSLTNVGNAGASNGFYFPIIMMASNHTIVDPDLIEPGMKLRIPDLTRNLANAQSRKGIKECIGDVAHIYNRRGRTSDEQGLTTLANSL